MEFTIFYSWQSERADASEFIRRQLEDCCRNLSERLHVGITVKDADADNRGSYNINTAVIAGIRDADIVVADLTPTSHGDDGRANPNANSLYEYAYACAWKGFEDVIAVTDVSRDSTRNMPFDWNHNSLVTFNGVGDGRLADALTTAVERIVMAKLLPTLHWPTTVFFSKRMSESFPGLRGLREYTDQHDIKMHLDALFRHPIVFGEAIDREGDRQPVWWFRGGSCEAIVSYRVLKNGIYLLNGNEFRIRRIIAFGCPQRPYSEYVYIETEGLPPVVDKSITKEYIERITKDLGYCDEEYGVVKAGGMEINVSAAEFDDGHAEINGEIVRIGENSERRCRFLASYNFVVCAKFSAINCHEFDLRSRPIFEGILNGTVPFEELHNLIASLQKPHY